MAYHYYVEGHLVNNGEIMRRIYAIVMDEDKVTETVDQNQFFTCNGDAERVFDTSQDPSLS